VSDNGQGGAMKTSKVIIFTTICVLLCMPLYAQELKGMIFVSNQTEELNPSKKVREYIIRETAYCVFLVQGFSTDSSGFVDLAADIKFIDPQKKVLFEEKNYTICKKQLVQGQGIMLLNDSFDIEFDSGDPLGMYTLEVIVKDNIAKSQDVAQTTLLLFDTPESRRLIMAPVNSAKQLDDLWAEYFRSKNPWAVKRIISALRLRKESNNLEGATVGGAAQWSLEANAKQHAEVLSICEQSLEYAKGSAKELLEEIINNVKKSK